jgi:hypothetical protein
MRSKISMALATQNERGNSRKGEAAVAIGTLPIESIISHLAVAPQLDPPSARPRQAAAPCARPLSRCVIF